MGWEKRLFCVQNQIFLIKYRSHTVLVMGVKSTFKCRSGSIQLFCHMWTENWSHLKPDIFYVEIIIATVWCLTGVKEEWYFTCTLQWLWMLKPQLNVRVNPLKYYTVCEHTTGVTPDPEIFVIEIIIAKVWCLTCVNAEHGWRWQFKCRIWMSLL